MSWGADALGITEDTFRMVKAATAGITTTSEMYNITVEELVSLVPVDTPFFNSTPRRPAPRGARFAAWQVLLNVNSSQPDGGIPRDSAANVINIENQWVYSPYAVVGSGGKVSWDALAEAEGTADALAVDTIQTINQQLISLEIHQLNAQSFALPTIGTPALVPSTSGGSLATGDVYVKCSALSGLNWYRGNGLSAQGSGVASAEATTAVTGPDASVTATVAAVKGAAGYQWFVGSATGAEFYYTTTYVNTVDITSMPTAAATIPNLPGLFQSGQAGPAVPTTDQSYQTYWQNGLSASILGDFSANPDNLETGFQANLVTPGTGVSQGAYYASLGGHPFTVSGSAILEIDEMNRAIYDTYNISTTRMLCGSKVINDISNAILDNPQAVTWLVPTDRDGRAHVVAGGHVATYLNKTVNGVPIELHLMPYLPPGQLIAVADEIPFPGANMVNPIEVETLYDFFRFDYGADRANGGPRFDFEVRTEQSFKNKAAPAMGVLNNIGDLS
jgi:hypothetical protein